jgi:PadR family transcriptional regulator PadR
MRNQSGQNTASSMVPPSTAHLVPHDAASVQRISKEQTIDMLRILLWHDHRFVCHTAVVIAQENRMPDEKLDLLQGTLDLMVLQTLSAIGTQHGYGIARRIEQVSGHEVLLNQGTIYASLVRLQQRGWIDAAWGTSDNNRKAKFYSITKRGRKQLAEDAVYWRRLSAVMGRVLSMQPEGGE